MKEMITINNRQLEIETTVPLTQDQRANLMAQLETMTQMKTMASTCNKSTANVGDIINLKTNGTGGTPTYTATFSQSGGTGTVTLVGSQSGLAEGVNASATYTVLSGDAGKSITFTSYVTDSCSTGAKTSTTGQCIVAVNVPCIQPTCNFTVS
jgi:hypothetical protein